MFQHIEYYAGDPILGLVEKFLQDKRPEKVNLGIGIYLDANGKLPVLPSVAQAEQARMQTAQPRPYLPMEGLAEFRQAVQKLVFGLDNEARINQRIATIQTLGGSGALKIGADFLHKWFPHAKAYISNPTWENHRSIFEGAGIEVQSYPYYNTNTGGLLFDETLAFFQQLPKHSILILHPCCHNPTGVDFTTEQWDKVLDIIEKNELIAFMDMAYQGFADSLEQDAYAIRAATQRNITLLVSNSFSKNLSFYGERSGGLSIVCPDAAQAERVLGQLKAGVRKIYSSPPAHAAYITAAVMNTPQWYDMWQNEVEEMRNRIHSMRCRLHQLLNESVPSKQFDYLIQQRGMFSYTGLTAQQVQRLQDEFAIYLLASGRMCIAGLNEHNLAYVAQALLKVTE